MTVGLTWGGRRLLGWDTAEGTRGRVTLKSHRRRESRLGRSSLLLQVDCPLCCGRMLRCQFHCYAGQEVCCRTNLDISSVIVIVVKMQWQALHRQR